MGVHAAIVLDIFPKEIVNETQIEQNIAID